MGDIETQISNCLSQHTGSWDADGITQALYQCAIKSGYIGADVKIPQALMDVVQGIKNCLGNYGGPWTADGVLGALQQCSANAGCKLIFFVKSRKYLRENILS